MCYVYIYLLQKDTRTVALSLECLFFSRIMENIQILQLSECLSATNIYGQNTFLTCDFIFMQHNSHSDKFKSLNLRTCKSINLQSIHIYIDSI